MRLNPARDLIKKREEGLKLIRFAIPGPDPWRETLLHGEPPHE